MFIILNQYIYIYILLDWDLFFVVQVTSCWVIFSDIFRGGYVVRGYRVFQVQQDVGVFDVFWFGYIFILKKLEEF